MLKFLKNFKELCLLLAQVNIKKQSNIFLIELDHYILTINPKLLLINSSLEQAQQISELEALYGDKWANIYKDIVAKKRLEDNFSKGFTTNNKCTCKEVSSEKINNVCS